MIELHQDQMIPLYQLDHYREMFVGRSSDFALQQPNGRYVRAGRPLSNTELSLHLLGAHTIGTYVMNEQGICRFAVFDADTADGIEQLCCLKARLANDGCVSHLEAFRRGGHLWVLFQTPLLASQVRAWLLPFCPDGVEFYPKQAEGSGYGSLIRLPFGVHRLTGKRYPFYQRTPTEETLNPTTLDALLNWVPQAERTLVPAHRLTPSPRREPPHPHQSLAPTPLRLLSCSTNTIHAWCATQDAVKVIGQYVTLNQYGQGCCPFGGHHTHGRDRHPSFKAYTPTRIGGSCWYCYTWNRGGNLFDFLCHWYNVDASTMWRRIQAGEISC